MRIRLLKIVCVQTRLHLTFTVISGIWRLCIICLLTALYCISVPNVERERKICSVGREGYCSKKELITSKFGGTRSVAALF